MKAFLAVVQGISADKEPCFATMSLMLFGEGYVFIALIQNIVGNGYSWVTQTEFAKAIAIGQVTPGSILISCQPTRL